MSLNLGKSDLCETACEQYTSRSILVRYITRKFLEKLNSLISDIGMGSVLDVGCGTGELIHTISDRCQITAIDVSPVYIRVAKERIPQTQFLRASVYNLPFRDRSFPIVLCAEVLEHLERPSDALNELGRVSTKYCIITVPNDPLFRAANLARGRYISRLGKTPWHLNNWTRTGLACLLNEHFKKIHIRRVAVWLVAYCEC